MALSPMMQEYVKTKEANKDCILMYRVGDFFEMFFDDALTVSKELELTLTGKECGLPERAPMCGVPYHAVDTYIGRLVKGGHKVAVCDQVEDPKQAKGLVRREITRIVTPGTNFDASQMEEGKNNYLVSIVCTADRFGIASCDVSTGEFMVTETDRQDRLLDELNKLAPSEIICNEALMMSGLDMEDLKVRLHALISPLDERYFSDEDCEMTLRDHFHVQTMEGLGIDHMPCGICAAGALINYLFETQKTDLSHISHIRPYRTEMYMVLGTSTMRNLELTETLREKEKRGSLLWVLNHTKTAMGARMLRKWIEQPLLVKNEILRRLDAVEALTNDAVSSEELREYLSPVYDLERLVGRISLKSANPRDLISLKTSLAMLPHIRNLLPSFSCDLFREFYDSFDTLDDIHDLIEQSIREDPPLAMKEGDIIRDGWSKEVDECRDAKTEGKRWLAELEAREREKTGIHTLKVKYNRVFGYCIEVTNSFKDKVPDSYTRKQTLVGGERYMTPELKELEDRMLGAQDRLYGDNKKKRISVITGPNMAGKSTYMRQTALIVLMAQIGSFVPAKSAVIGIVDRIFTRVGASDDLASGQSTFMVEMTEVAGILRNATSRSLLILDEIGRGTSTFDGLALAWSIIEYVADRKLIGAKTLFATHYHELTELEGKIDGVNNYCIAVKEKGDTIVFLRKIVRGGADRSYGIQVARLAGVPEAVLTRAGQLLAELAKADITEAIETVAGAPKKKKKSVHYDEVDLSQMSFFDAVSDQDVLDELRGIDIQTLTPLDALNELYHLQAAINRSFC